VLGEERAWARSWRDTNALAQTSLGEKKNGPSQSLRDCTRDEAASDSKSRRVTGVQRSLVPHVSSSDDLAAFAGEETTQPFVSVTTVGISFGRQPTTRGDHDQDARLHFPDRICDPLAHRVRPDRRHPCSVAAAQQSRSEPGREPPHIPGPCGCTCQSQAGPAQPLRQAGHFIDRRGAQQLERRDGGRT
jgi:hypothetical protein